MVLDLSLTENDPSVARRGLVDIGAVDDKEDLLGENVNPTIHSKTCLERKGCNVRSLAS